MSNSLAIENLRTITVTLAPSNNYSISNSIIDPIIEKIYSTIKVRFIFSEVTYIQTNLVNNNFDIEFNPSTFLDPTYTLTDKIYNCGSTNKENWYDTNKSSISAFYISCEIPPNNIEVPIVLQFI